LGEPQEQKVVMAGHITMMAESATSGPNINGASPIAAGEPLLEVRGVSKFFGAVRALHDVRLEVRPAEVVALAGDNGAGKSTLVKILSGIISPDGGEISFAGHPIDITDPHDAAALGIQTIYQDLALCDNLNVTENVFLGREHRRPLWRGRRMERARMEKQARIALEALGATIRDMSAPVEALSGGQRQCVAICRAIIGDAKLIILDEPTAALGVTQRRDVLTLIERLRDQGKGVVVVSHDLSEVLRIADRIVVLRLGTTVADRPASEWTPDLLVSAITGSAGFAIGDMR
jgi:D-xylose transport system ATP-binding protein